GEGFSVHRLAAAGARWRQGRRNGVTNRCFLFGVSSGKIQMAALAGSTLLTGRGLHGGGAPEGASPVGRPGRAARWRAARKGAGERTPREQARNPIPRGAMKDEPAEKTGRHRGPEEGNPGRVGMRPRAVLG